MYLPTTALPVFILPKLPVGEQTAPLGRDGVRSQPRALDQSQRMFGLHSFGKMMVNATATLAAPLP